MWTEGSRLTSPTSKCSATRTRGPRHAIQERPGTWPIKTSRARLRILRADRRVSRRRVRVVNPAHRNRAGRIVHQDGTPENPSYTGCPIASRTALMHADRPGPAEALAGPATGPQLLKHGANFLEIIRRRNASKGVPLSRHHHSQFTGVQFIGLRAQAAPPPARSAGGLAKCNSVGGAAAAPARSRPGEDRIGALG